MNTRDVVVCALLTQLVSACKLTQIVPPSDLQETERGAFTTDGRFFVIGVRPSGKPDAGAWIVEVTDGPSNRYVATDYVSGNLEGTSDGTLARKPAGDACTFGGMAAHGELLYAACYAADGRSSLLQVDTQAHTVRAGYFTTCNFTPSTSPCSSPSMYPNGMAVDSQGRVYISNTLSHFTINGSNISVNVQGSDTLSQVIIDPIASQGTHLEFRYHDWFSGDILTDSFVPNGIQIEGQTLYYAAGPNINQVEIQGDGTAGLHSVHYLGPALSYIDDFTVRGGRMALARTLPPAIVFLGEAPPGGLAPELGTYPMPLTAIPSSVVFQGALPTGDAVFPVDSLEITSFFGGGLYVLTGP